MYACKDKQRQKSKFGLNIEGDQPGYAYYRIVENVNSIIGQ